MRSASSSTAGPLRRTLGGTLALVLALLALVCVPTHAAGNPDVALSVDVQPVALLGDTIPVRLTATNPTGTSGYNASFRLVLPPGASLSSGAPAPTTSIVRADGATVVVWRDVSDLVAGSSTSVTAQVSAGSLPLGSHSLAADVYVNAAPRVVPAFDATGTATSASYTGWASATDATELVPFTISTDVLRPENELVRGVHDQKTVVRVTVDNNLVGSSTGFEVVQYLPAQLEFLACGATDNTAPGVEEHPGSGRIDDAPAPALTAPCPAPSSVETVTADPPGPQPSGTYTVVRWDTATLAALGWDTRAAAGSFTFQYVVGVPQDANVAFAAGTPTSGVQGANLDNNTGASTLETTEPAVTVVGGLAGTYAGTRYTTQDEETVTLEDLAIQKGVSTGEIVQGGVSTWTLELQVSEYSTSVRDVVVTDTLPDGLCPLGAGDADCPGGPTPSPAYSSATENADGSWTLVWELADQTANATPTITFSTRTRTNYQEGFSDAEPVRANDSWTNSVDVTGTATDLDGAVRAVADDSAADQVAGPIDLSKEVAAPDGTGTCVEGADWEQPQSSTTFGPGDLVCWRLTVTTPSGLDTTGLVLTDFLPAGHEVVTWAPTSANDATIDAPTVAEPRIDWTFGNDLDAASTAQLVLTTRITDPGVADVGDVPGNLAKLRYTNTAGTVFQLRDVALAPWHEPVLAIVKSAPVSVAQGGATVRYTVAVTNNGNVTALDVEVRDLLPAGIDCADVTPVDGGLLCTDEGATDRLDTTVASIAAGATATLTYDVTLPTALAPGQVLDNTAGVRRLQVATNDPDAPRFVYVPSNNIDPALEPAANSGPVRDGHRVAVAAATVTKTATTSVVEPGNTAAQVTVGEVVTYTVDVLLPNDTTIADGVVADAVPATLQLDPASVALSLDGTDDPAGFALTSSATQISVTLPTPYTVGATDQVLRLTFAGQVRDVSGVTAGANITNTARLSHRDAGGTAMPQRTGSVTTRVVEPDLGVLKTSTDADGIAAPGEVIAFDVVVSNPDTTVTPAPTFVSTAHDVVVVDRVPTSMTPLGAGGTPLTGDGVVVPDGGLWDASDRTITWTIASVPAGPPVVLDYEVQVADPVVSPATFTNTVTATTTSLAGPAAGERVSGGTNPARYADTSTVTLAGPRPSVTKSADVESAPVGATVTYTVTAVVPPSVTTFDATVLDTLPAGLAYVRTVSTACTTPSPCDVVATPLPADGQRLGWFLGDLAPSADERRVRIVYEATVADVAEAVDGAVLTNSALIGFNDVDEVGTPTTPPAAHEFAGTSVPATDPITVVEPALTLSKAVAGPDGPVAARRVVPGEEVTYTVTLTNTGSATAYDVVVADTVDDRMTAAAVQDGPADAWSVTDGDPSDGTLGFVVPTLAPGASVGITYVLAVPALTADDEVAGAELLNTADAAYTSVPGGGRSYDDVDPATAELEADLASVGDRVWYDQDGDGTQDAGEPGVPGVTVTVVFAGQDGVLGNGDDETRTATTGPDGGWLIETLPGGTFQTSVSDLPDGTQVTSDLTGTPPTGPVTFALAEDGERRDVDFGVGGAGSLGDLVWLDLDADGAQDAGEPGLAGVGVDVVWHGPDGALGTADDVTFPTTTGAGGRWSVTGLPAGALTVTLDATTFPPGTGPASDPDGDRGVDADATASGTLVDGGTDLSFDFGLRGTGLVGDRLWVDTDADGVQDPTDEPGIPGASVQVRWIGPDGVTGTADDAVVTTTTGADGAYEVGSLPGGGYEVSVLSLPTALAPTFDEDTGTTGPDGSTALTLAPGAEHRTADFGFRADTAVGDTVWLDVDGDGLQDPGEPGLPGVGVTVTSAGADGALGTPDDIVRTTTTGADGTWLVGGLPAGPTRVEVTGGLPAGIVPTADADGTATPGVSELTLADGDVVLTQDFGYVGRNSIGDRVWVDVDRDGVQDTGEPGLGGIVLEVSAGGVVVQVVTAGDGSWLADGLPDGDWTVRVVGGVPAGYAVTADETGAADGVSQVPGLGSAGPQDHVTADVGLGGSGVLGGTIWLDRDADGVLDEVGEGGIPGIGLTVTWAGPDGVAGTPDDVAIPVTTGPGGVWSVEGLPPGGYDVEVDASTLPAGVTVVFDREHGTTSPDGTWSGTLGPAEVRRDVDTGVRGDGSLSGRVWEDEDRDGRQDLGEPGAGGVTVVVTWTGPDGAPGGGDDVVIPVRTGPDGRWTVPWLPAGSSSVVLDESTLPSGTRAVSDVDGGDPMSAVVTLAAGEHRTDVDVALVRAAAAAPSDRLPRTGAQIGGLVLLSLLLTAVGALLLRRARPHGRHRTA